MVILHTCKNEEDPIKNEDARVLTRLYVVFSDAQGQLTPKSAVEFCRKLKLIQTFIVVLVTCKNEEDPIKNEGGRVLTSLLFRRSRAANSEVNGGILPKFELIQAFIVVLLTCKNVKDQIKNKGSRVLTRFSPL